MAMSIDPATTGVKVETPFGVEDLDIKPFLLEDTLLERELDERTVPKATLRNRDLQRLGRRGAYKEGRHNRSPDHACDTGDRTTHSVFLVATFVQTGLSPEM
jgi:hypothetical protein